MGESPLGQITSGWLGRPSVTSWYGQALGQWSLVTAIVRTPNNRRGKTKLIVVSAHFSSRLFLVLHRGKVNHYADYVMASMNETMG